MRSYIRQQRCRGQQREVEAEVGEAQGGAAVGTAKEAVATSAKPRGGTNGWGSNKTPCWNCWQKVLLVLLVWMVAPAEAARAAQAAGGVAAAAAAVAVGANEVLNYWAGLKDDTAGDLKVLSKGPGIIRVMSTGLRRVKRDQAGQDMSKVVWEQTMRAVGDAAVDIWAAQHTRVEDGGAPGQAALWSASS